MTVRRPVAGLGLVGAAMLVTGAALHADGSADVRATDAVTVDGAAVQPVAEARGRVLTVLAAASLVDAFAGLADAFEAAHPDVTVLLSVGPSQALAAQVAAGAAADVLATADPATMAVALRAEPDAVPVTFARNTLALAVADGADVDGLDDLAAVPFALCHPDVPCGAAARRVLATAGVTADPTTYGTDVTAVLTQVVWGQVDAGLVYASDVRPSAPVVNRGEVRALAIPAALNTVTTYPVVALPDGPEPALARAFVQHVLSSAGRRTLTDAGFGAP